MTGSVRINLTMRHILAAIVAVEKEEVLYILERYLSRMRRACAILSSMACPALLYFSTLSQKRHDFLTEDTGNKMCILSSFTMSLRNISHYKKN